MKKPRHRIWYYPVFDAEKKELEKKGILGNIKDDEFPILFDRKEDAYALAMANRLETKRDENGNIVTSDEGYAQLEDHGKITLIGLKGKMLDWKKIKRMQKQEGMKGSVIVLHYEVKLNKQHIAEMLVETDEMYERHINSPLAKAGGLGSKGESLNAVDATEAIQSEIEQRASS